MVSLVAVVGVLYAMCYTAQSASINKQFPFSAALKQHATDLHNNFRANVAKGNVTGQPAASNMLALVWDDTLAAKAKAWAEKCNFEHSNGQNVPGYFWVGENLAVGTMNTGIANDDGLKQQVTAGFNMWSGEAKDYKFPNCAGGKVCGHYTQLVWAKTRKFGCGLAQCNGMGGWDIGNKLAYLLVCNYGPGGNFNNEKPYTQGTACSACTKDATSGTTGACNAAKLCN